MNKNLENDSNQEMEILAEINNKYAKEEIKRSKIQREAKMKQLEEAEAKLQELYTQIEEMEAMYEEMVFSEEDTENIDDIPLEEYMDSQDLQ